MVTYRKDETQRPDGWNTGAPPHVGWWNVKCKGSGDKYLSWWNGEFFGRVMYFGNDKDIQSKTYCIEKSITGFDKWSWLWPENARVARVNPETGEVTGSGPCPYETSGQSWPFGDVKKKAEDAPKLKKKPAGNRKVTRYVLMNNARPIYIADTLQELHDRMKAMPRIIWTHYEKLRNRKKA